MSRACRLKNVCHVFLDMDGTLYRGNQLFPTTIPFFEFLSEHGIGRTFLSNNCSYGHRDYVEKLSKMGICCSESEIYSSADFCLDYLKIHHPEFKRVYILGMPCLQKAFTEAGFEVVEDQPEAVVVGFDRNLEYQRLCRCAYFLHLGVPGFATHPDVFCPTDLPTRLVDCGAVTACLEAATGKKLTVLGKPDPRMLQYAAKRLNIDVHNCLMAGDRLTTDIALGQNAGALTCHIISPGADLYIPEGITPDYSCENLGELQEHWQKLLQ